MAFYNIGYAITHPALWLDWTEGKAVMRFIYYGASQELFFAVLALFLTLTALGLWRNAHSLGVLSGSWKDLPIPSAALQLGLAY